MEGQGGLGGETEEEGPVGRGRPTVVGRGFGGGISLRGCDDRSLKGLGSAEAKKNEEGAGVQSTGQQQQAAAPTQPAGAPHATDHVKIA